MIPPGNNEKAKMEVSEAQKASTCTTRSQRTDTHAASHTETCKEEYERTTRSEKEEHAEQGLTA